MLELRDRRMDAARRRRSRIVSLLLLIGAGIVGVWFAVFFFSDDTTMPGSVAPTKTRDAEKAPGGMKIDKGDVHFAIELMEFMGGGSKGGSKGGDTKPPPKPEEP